MLAMSFSLGQMPLVTLLRGDSVFLPALSNHEVAQWPLTPSGLYLPMTILHSLFLVLSICPSFVFSWCYISNLNSTGNILQSCWFLCMLPLLFSPWDLWWLISMHPHEWAMGCSDIWYYVIWHVSVRLFLDETNIGFDRLGKAELS